MKISKDVLKKVVDMAGRNNLQLSYLISVAFTELNGRMEAEPERIQMEYGTNLKNVVERLNDQYRTKC